MLQMKQGMSKNQQLCLSESHEKEKAPHCQLGQTRCYQVNGSQWPLVGGT